MMPAVDDATFPAISSVHPDIIQTHILTRLDGPTLASASCASSHLHSLSSSDTLWREICNHTWPSTSHPRVRHVISSFPSGHRSFYSDSFPDLHTTIPGPHPVPASELISAVDLKFRNRSILSRVQTTETKTGWFMGSPFRVDLLDPKETVQTGISLDACLTDVCVTNACHSCQTSIKTDACLELQSFSLSWILIDPARARAADFSSTRPVSVTRHWLTGDLHVRFAKIIKQGEGEHVQCAVVVTCKRGEDGGVHVKEVSFVVEDMEGRSLSGEDSLVILQGAMENGERRRRKSGEEERERYEEYLEMKRERREMKERKERRMDMVCVFTVVTLLVTWGTLLLKISS